MSSPRIQRRDFITGVAAAGLGAPLLVRGARGEPAPAPPPAGPAAVLPVVVASPNGARRPGGGPGKGGPSCVERGMEILKAGGDTLDAVIAGVNLVEDDPTEMGFGYVGAAGSTGRGEECIFINGAHTVVENMRRGMSPADAALDAIKRVAARYGNNRDELRAIGIDFYAVNRRGEHGAASLWKGGRYAVHDGERARLLPSAYLLA